MDLLRRTLRLFDRAVQGTCHYQGMEVILLRGSRVVPNHAAQRVWHHQPTPQRYPFS